MSDEIILLDLDQWRASKSRALVPVSQVPIPVAPSPIPKRHFARRFLSIPAVILGASGIVINAWFSHSLGSTPVAGYLFLAVGLATDTCALALPTATASLQSWCLRLLAWSLWSLTFAWALIASCGFVSVNVADVSAARTSPAIELARRAADTATISRQAECIKRGPLCREREADERAALSKLEAARNDTVVDPQSAGAARLIAWLTAGVVSPKLDDIAVLRLLLLTLLPQIGGLVLLVARA
jgi:hypothetical protein